MTWKRMKKALTGIDESNLATGFSGRPNNLCPSPVKFGCMEPSCTTIRCYRDCAKTAHENICITKPTHRSMIFLTCCGRHAGQKKNYAFADKSLSRIKTPPGIRKSS